MSLLGREARAAYDRLTTPRRPSMSDLTWDDLDAMVEGDPLALRDKAWAEIFRLRTQERAARLLRVQAQAQLAELRAQRDTGQAPDGPDLDETAALIHSTIEMVGGHCIDGEGYQLCRHLAHEIRSAVAEPSPDTGQARGADGALPPTPLGDCVHCGAPVEEPPGTINGEHIVWHVEGQRAVCAGQPADASIGELTVAEAAPSGDTVQAPDADTTPDVDVREELVDVLDTHMRLDDRADAERVADVLIARPDLLRALLGADTTTEEATNG